MPVKVHRGLQSATAPNVRRNRHPLPTVLAAPPADPPDGVTSDLDDVEVVPKYCVQCASKKGTKLPGLLLCAKHYYPELSRSRQCNHDAGTVRSCVALAAKTYALCPRHLGQLVPTPAPLCGDIDSDVDDGGEARPVPAPPAPRDLLGSGRPNYDDSAPPARRLPRSEVSRQRAMRDVETASIAKSRSSSDSDGDEEGEEEDQPSRRRIVFPPSVVEYLSSVPDFVRTEIEAEFSVGPPEPITVEETLGLKFGERLADSVEGATFARPVVDPAHPSTTQRVFVARDSPVADVFVDPLDGQVYVRFVSPGANNRVPESHSVMKLEEVSAYYPQILIDFLLASVIFRD